MIFYLSSDAIWEIRGCVSNLRCCAQAVIPQPTRHDSNYPFPPPKVRRLTTSASGTAAALGIKYPMTLAFLCHPWFPATAPTSPFVASAHRLRPQGDSPQQTYNDLIPVSIQREIPSSPDFPNLSSFRNKKVYNLDSRVSKKNNALLFTAHQGQRPTLRR